MKPLSRTSADGRDAELPEAQLIVALTGVRAVMGLWVIADHVYPAMVKLLPELEPLRFALSGGIALDTFFILSGFVISHRYADRMVGLDRHRYGRFVWARFSRVYPTHLFALLVVAASLPLLLDAYGSRYVQAVGLDVWSFLANVFMLQAVPGVTAWNSASWAVSTEFAAYLLFPFFAAALSRASRRTALTTAAVLVVTQLPVLHLLTASPSLAPWAVLWVRPLGEFALGCLLWATWRHGVRRHRLWDVLAVGALAGVLLVTWATRWGVPLFAAVPLLGLLVVAVSSSTGVVRSVLSLRPVQWAGRTSYSRYLLHVPVLTVFGVFLPVSVFTAYAHEWFRSVLVALWFVTTFVVGALVFRLVERPAQRWLRRHGPGAVPAAARADDDPADRALAAAGGTPDRSAPSR